MRHLKITNTTNPGRRTLAGYTLLLIIWQLLLSFQGLDLADTGFHLSAFRFILEDPYAVQYSMVFWLSDIFGYAWMQLLPSGGLFWCRIGGLFFFTLTFLVYQHILRKETDAKRSFTGLFIISLFILKGGFECLNYDILTMLGYALVVLFLYGGLKDRKVALLFVGGMVLGVNTFFRLTNVSGLMFLLMIPFYLYLEKEKPGAYLRTLAVSTAGFLAGAGSILGLILLLGHWELYIDNLHFIFNVASDSEASHGIVPLVTAYAGGFINGLILVILFAAALWVYGKIPPFSGKKRNLLARKAIPVILISAAALLMILFQDAFWSKIRYLLIGLVLLAGIQYTRDKRKPDSYRLLSLGGLILFLVTPLGSDSWLGKSVFGMWILVPLILTENHLGDLFRPLKPGISSQAEKMILLSLRGIIIVTALIFAWQNTYFDAGSRWLKRTPVQHEKLRCIYTSEERAGAVNELILEAFPLIKEEYLLSFIEIPMVNYLADKKPFISTSWPKLYYNVNTFENKLEEALARRESLPAVVRQKQNTGIVAWPADTAAKEYLDYPDDLSRWPAHGRVLNKFLDQQGYEVIWENNMFQLLLPRE